MLRKRTLMAMTASVALLAGLMSSSDAFPFNWPTSFFPQSNFGQQRHVTRPARVPRPAATGAARDNVAANENEKSATKPNDKDKSANKETPADIGAKTGGVLTIAVSINKQQLTLYSDGVPIARSRVFAGYQTPTGVFSIIQKDRWHRSDAHGGAPMYYMQRITWSGVGMCEGAGPTPPGSQSAIRLPEAFARQLWGATKIGVRVIITQGDVAPSTIASPRLFTRKPDLEAKRDADESSGAGPSSAQIVESAYSALAAAPRKRNGATQGSNRGSNQGSNPSSNAGSKTGDPARDAMAFAVNEREQATSSAVVRSAYDKFDLSKARRNRSAPATTGVAEFRSLKPGPISVFISRQEGKLFVRKGFDPVFNVPVKFDVPDRPLGTHVFTALAVNDDDSMRWNVITVPTTWNRTAGRRNGAELLSVGKPSTAAEALGRVTIPQDAFERITELMSPGASVIISDQGLGPETGTGTDFTVLTR
jgi:lipoprotein-anchoring transpeptidase ErfK/SrfK